MVTLPHKMVGLEGMLDYGGVGLERFHCTEKCKINLSMNNITYNETSLLSDTSSSGLESSIRLQDSSDPQHTLI